MNKFLDVVRSKFAVAMASGLVGLTTLAEGGITANNGTVTADTGAITGTGGVLDTVASYINSAADAAWPYIVGIIGVGLLIWLGRALLRAVRAYFSTAM